MNKLVLMLLSCSTFSVLMLTVTQSVRANTFINSVQYFEITKSNSSLELNLNPAFQDQQPINNDARNGDLKVWM
jgi:hypothetical protein